MLAQERVLVPVSQLLVPLLSILQRAAIGPCDYASDAGHNPNLDANLQVPLPIDLLKEIRAWLISLESTRGTSESAQNNLQAPIQVGTKDTEAERPRPIEVVTATTSTVTAIDSTVTQKTRSLFALIIYTACLPSLTNPHRTITCDALSTWLIRASSWPIAPSNIPLHYLLCAPFHHSNPSASPIDIAEHRLSVFKTLTHIFLANFDSSASAALSKSLKDFIVTLLGCYKDIFHLGPPSDDDKGFVDILVTETLALIGFGFPKTATESLTITPLFSESSRKAVYFILEVLAIRKVASAEYLLTVSDCSTSSQQGHNLLLGHLLTTVCTRTYLASAAAKAFLAILTARKAELLQQKAGLVVWESIWDDLLRAALRGDLVSPDSTHEGAGGASKVVVVARGNLTTYILPGVLKLAGVDGLQRFVAGFQLAIDGMSQPEDLNAWLCCICVGREMGIVDDIVSSSHESSTGSATSMHLPPHLLPSLLTHSSPPIRISALTLITASRQTTLSPSAASFSLLRAYLPYFHAATDPESRNTIAGLIRAFIERLAGASQSIARKACRALTERGDLAQELDLQVAEIRRFVEWYVSFIRSEMLPGKSFSRVGMALRVLRMWVNSGVDQLSTDRSKAKAIGHGSRHFPFSVPILNGPTAEAREMARLLLECLFHSFEDVRVEAAEVIKIGLLPISAWAMECVDQEFLRRCFRKAQTAGGRMKDADGLARALEIVYEAAITWKDGFRVSIDLLGGADIDKAVILSTPLQYLTYIIEVVLCGNILTMLKTCGLVEGVKRCSAIHGIISGLRHIFERKDIYNGISCAAEADILIWRGFHHKLISVCYTIWDLIGPALCAAAPEGHMPDVGDEGDGGGETEDPDFAGEDVSTQTVMSFSWRAIKGSSELLSTLILRAPYPDILSSSDISYGGEILITQLANIRHPGAFASVFPCLLQVCKKCFCCSDPGIQNIPRLWLMESLDLIVTRADAITRRSAGIPFLIVGILSAEDDPERPLLKETFTRFVEIANMPPQDKRGKETDENGSTKLDLPQVHALNCIKLLFIDSHLGPIVLDLISSGLKVAVHSFSSPIWAIRNGGLMLFMALLNRLFGTNKSRNDYSFTANLYTTRRFFEKYPEVRGVLLSQLQQGVDSMSSPSTNLASNVSMVEMVYPALSLVSRLGFSPGYVAMNEFRPLIEKCMESHIGKVREVAARAYITLICPGDCIVEIQRLLASNGQVQRQNTLHGNLLVVKCMLEQRIVDTAAKMGVESVVMAKEISRILEGRFDEFVRRNECLVTRALYLEIAGIVALNYEGVFSVTLGALSEGVMKKVDTAIASLRSLLFTYATKATIFSEPFAGSKVVGNSTFKQQVAALLVHSFIKEGSSTRITEIISLIQEDDDEVTLAIVNILLRHPSALNLVGNNTSLLKTILWQKAVSDSSWEQVRIACMQLLHVVLGRYPEDTLIDIDCWLLLDLIQRPRTLPLKEAALVVLGKMMHHIFLSDLDNRWQLLSAWMEQVHATSYEEMPYSSRKAALCSLVEMAPVLDLSLPCQQKFLLPLYMSLYRFLNDDEEEIRDLASVFLTQKVLHLDYHMIPLAASDILARKLGELFQTDILDMAVKKMIGEKGIQDLIDETRRNSEVLFIKEKENIWVDELWEVDLWKDIINRIIKANEGKGDDIRIPLERLLTFVGHGLRALLNYRHEVEDKEELKGNTSSDMPLGWITSSEGIFVLGRRVFGGLEVVKLWVTLMGPAAEVFGSTWPMVMELEECMGRIELFQSVTRVNL